MDAGWDVFWQNLVWDIAETGANDWIVRLAAAIVIGFLVWVCERLIRSFRKNVLPSLALTFDAKRRVQRALHAVSTDGKGL